MNALAPRAIVLLTSAYWTVFALSQGTSRPAVHPDLTGTYESISNDSVLPGDLRNSGSPRDVVLLPWALQQMKSNIKDDPWRMCQPVGQFRMMALEHNKIELAQTDELMLMLFGDVAHGLMRTIYLKRGHIVGAPVENVAPDPRHPQSKWLGDSVGHWNGNTLIVDSIGFNTRTWLNDAGAQHSEALHLVEQIRPIRSGQFLEYKMTAEDPMALARTYTYTRYFEKTNTEIEDDLCQDQ